MKPIQRLLLVAALALGVCWGSPTRADQLVTPPLALDDTMLLYHPAAEGTNSLPGINLFSQGGVPLSSTNGVPTGSNGKAPSQQTPPDTVLPASTNQFSALMVTPGLAVQGATNLTAPGQNFATNALGLQWPCEVDANNHVVAVLRSAQVGGIYFAQQVSFNFGSVIGPPATDENGVALDDNNRLTYWFAAPYTTNNYTNSPYYWSINAQAVFATQAGAIDIVWEKSTPYNGTPPSNVISNFAQIGSFYYQLYSQHYIVSGAPVKTPQKMYWTEGAYSQTGHLIPVPSERVSAIHVVYNNAFPQYAIPGDTSVPSSPPITNTFWFNNTTPLAIHADNVEGRIFVELLGEANPNGLGNRYLGFEIVDVSKAPTPIDITVDLGDRVPAFGDLEDDSYLDPAPIQDVNSPYFYQQTAADGTFNSLYATHETEDVNDFEVHWLITGVAGLEWPYVFDRYHEVWPSDPSKYVNYIRPATTTQQEAALTGVPLPADEAPAIAYADPLDKTRSFLDSTGLFYTMLDTTEPAQRTLLRFLSGNNVSFERVFSWLDADLKTPSLFANSLVTSLDGWDATAQTLTFPGQFSAPYVVTNDAFVGDRLTAPANELGTAGGGYLAGHIVPANGNSFDPNAYLDPFQTGFDAASLTSIIPVNAIPGSNTLEVWWFRQDQPDTALGFEPTYWPAVIAHYNLHWPTNAPEIIMANNAGTGPLDSLEAKGQIYRQPDPTLPGYNPNEEHAVMLGGQAYALRDDLNVTTPAGYTSDPFVLIQYVGSDGRPSMAPYHVRREAPEKGQLFDYIVTAGTQLQAPMPLPLLDQPIEGAGASATNYDTAPSGTAGDLPVGWASGDTNGTYALYANYVFQDRHHDFWVYRGANAGLPTLQSGRYNAVSNTFEPLPSAMAFTNQPFDYVIDVSRQVASLTASISPPLPSGFKLAVSTNGGVEISGFPSSFSSNTYTISIQDTGDGSLANSSLTLVVATNGSATAGYVTNEAPLALVSTNQYTGTNVVYYGRPPFLASPAAPSNSFTMQFYYKTESTFDWPGNASPPPVGSVVPYLLPRTNNGFVGNPTLKTTPSQNVVYRPVWPTIVNGQPVPTLFSGQTLTEPVNNLPAVRGQSSVQVLYQQSIATNFASGPAASSVKVYDPTVQKTAPLAALPSGVESQLYLGKYFFAGLPPNLANRIWYDPAISELVFEGQFIDDAVGLTYLLPNILAGSDLAAVLALCPTGDPAYSDWSSAVTGLSVSVPTFGESPGIPGSYVSLQTESFGSSNVVEVTNSEQQVDSYAMCATGPGEGYVSFIAGNTINPVHSGDPVTVYIIRVAPPLYAGEVKVIQDPGPLSQFVSFQHTSDLAGKSGDYAYDWRIAPPVDGLAPTADPSTWTVLTSGNDITHYTLGGQGIQTLGDNYVVMRYRNTNPSADPAVTNWSPWSSPAFVPGWIQRVLTGVNPFEQRTDDLFDNSVNTSGTIIEQAGHRWEGDVALNSQTLTNAGLIEIYETVMHVGENLSINSGYNYGPANDALLQVAGYLSDLYTTVAADAWADSLNPTIGIGTDDTTYGAIATSLFTFQGEVSSLLEQELALLRGRDDTLSPGVQLAPVYNRLYWNYTEGINAGEVIYALNYNILDENNDGKVDAADAAILYPMGHGDAYGHYLTALSYYYQLLLNPSFDWVPRIESVSVLGATVSVNYEDERKFAADAAALARTGRQVYDLTWREDYQAGTSAGWSYMDATNANMSRPYSDGGVSKFVTKYWGLDHWAARTEGGAYFNWVVGNAILPPVDPDPTHQGIQKVDRTTVPELNELPQTADQLQGDLDNTDAGFTPLNLSQNAIPFDINPLQVTGANPQTHFEQIYSRAITALDNAVTAFNDAQSVTEEMREDQNSLADFQAGVTSQELAYNNQLIEIYGTPYPDDIGVGKTYPQGYSGPDLIHYTYIDNPDTNTLGGMLPDPTQPQTFYLDVQNLPSDWTSTMYDNFTNILETTAPGYSNNPAVSVPFTVQADGFFGKPSGWTSERASVGSIQQAASQYCAALNTLRQDCVNENGDKSSLDKDMNAFQDQRAFEVGVSNYNQQITDSNDILNQLSESYGIDQLWENFASGVAGDEANALSVSIPTSFIFGTASGGNAANVVRGSVYSAALIIKWALQASAAGEQTDILTKQYQAQTAINADSSAIANSQTDEDFKNAVLALGQEEGSLQGDLVAISSQTRVVSDALAAYNTQVSKGNEIQAERLSFRQHAAAVVQGYRTRDAAFRLFQNEKLERYLALFNLAQEYAYLAAQAYDYETGLLNTPQGQAFLNQIISSQALGVVNNGAPQVTGSDTGDPGLSSALAEMKADWDVLKGRLGFNNPDGYGTVASLRSEKYRILAGSDGDDAWKQVLQNGVMADLLSDPDVKLHCLQIDNGSGLPVPGIELTFSTTISDGLNLFGNQLAPGDHYYTPSSFATKIFSVGVDFDGYIGMDNPNAGGGVSPPDPTVDPNALTATPYIYLIPAGADSMRSPPLGDTSTIRTWNVDDVAIPLPYNVGASDFSSNPFYTSANSLTEPLFSIRKHQAFRPVSSTSVFSPDIYGMDGSLQPSQYTNKRLIGRSVWNSKWKLIIPGRNLLSNPNDGLNRFINSVKDVKLYFLTYSYSGN